MRQVFWILLGVMILGSIRTQAQQVALTQTYSDDNVTFGYPAGWVVGQVSAEAIEVGSNIRALDAPTLGLDRGETYMRILTRVGALASASPQSYLEQLSFQATRNQVYGEIDAITLNGREAAIVTRDDLNRRIERIIAIIDMGDGRIGGMIATVAQGEIDLHMDNVLAILASLSATEAAESGYWTYVDELIRFRYPLDWAVTRVNDEVVNVRNTTGTFLGLPDEVLVQVVTFDLFATDVSYEQVVLSLEASEPTYQLGELTPTTIGTEDGAVVRYTIEDEAIEGLFVLFTLFDGRIGLVNMQTAVGELANYAEVLTTITESVEVPPTALLRGAQLSFDTFAQYTTEDENFSLFHPPNWLVLEIDTGLLISNDINITQRTVNDLEAGTMLMLVYPRVEQLPFPVDIRTPTAITNRFRLASASIGITQLSETIRTVNEEGLATSTVYGIHPNYDIWIISQEKPNNQILTSLVYSPRGEMGLHQRQVRTVTESFEYVGLTVTDCDITATSVINTRSGPGVAFSVQDALVADEPVQGIAQDIGADGLIWWQIEGGGWVREDVVEETENCFLLPPPQ